MYLHLRPFLRLDRQAGSMYLLLLRPATRERESIRLKSGLDDRWRQQCPAESNISSNCVCDSDSSHTSFRNSQLGQVVNFIWKYDAAAWSGPEFHDKPNAG